ncbi:precorrin-4 C11-methyltransferase [Methylobacter tundripaludum]|uniref:Precorrin-4 C11-methyltransferase n=1 Tax=Methylobacter tundripaludum TaxID=173365 RepID=A0A2S6HBZ5_9GAMM|nr:precorrin-4 C(11)-methyltransferase [Methylobacter tundripaludum]PPK75014.1 precorrin-4 C11-methyltransferase [Methylobacter tundripaludum]
MKVYFIGAGPGASDLITLRGANILGRVSMVLYAGSLVPTDMLQHCRPDAELIDTATLDLEQQEACYRRAQESGCDVARLHSGDPAIYGATAEQMRRLDALGIEYEIVPGVSSFTSAAASIKAELTKPEVSQTVILTRVSGRASAVPELESIARLAEHQATMCIFLSGPHLKKIVADLRLHYPDDTPVALVYRATWPEERSYQGTLGVILKETKKSEWNLTTMLLVGKALGRGEQTESSLYSKDFTHIFRVVKKKTSTST